MKTVVTTEFHGVYTHLTRESRMNTAERPRAFKKAVLMPLLLDKTFPLLPLLPQVWNKPLNTFVHSNQKQSARLQGHWVRR